jgi:hypothetical protein
LYGAGSKSPSFFWSQLLNANSLLSVLNFNSVYFFFLKLPHWRLKKYGPDG